MRPKIARLLTFLVVGCAAQPARLPERAASVTARPLPPPVEPAQSLQPAEVLTQADQAYDSHLGIARGGRFDTERQIAVLRQAVLLYGQFLERAEGRPELEPAVRKSRERMADAKETIIFLEASLPAQDQLPPRPGRD